MRKKSLMVVLVILVLTLNCTAWAERRYLIQEIGTFGGSDSFALALNESGTVVGYAEDGTGMDKAFYYARGVQHALRTKSDQHSYALDINDRGTILGRYVIEDPSHDPYLTKGHAWLFSHGKYTMIANATDTRMNKYHGLTRLNNKGVAAGEVYFDPYEPVPAIYEKGRMKLLSMGVGGVNDINDAKVSVGWMEDRTGMYILASVWPDSEYNDNYTFRYEWESTELKGINEWNEMVGFYCEYDQCHGFFKDPYSISRIEIGPDTRPSRVNDSGHVVGYMQNDDSQRHAFIYVNGTLYDLNDYVIGMDDWDYLEQANDINNHGQIVGVGYIDGNVRGFLLTPYKQLGEYVPFPK